MRCPDCGVENIQGTEDCDHCRAPLAPLSHPQPKGNLPKKILEGTMADIKPRQAVVVAADCTVAEAARRMRESKIGCALVLNGEKVVGIMTERDLVLSVAGVKKPAEVTVGEVMHADPICLKEDDPVSFAFHHMTIGGYRHLPVYLHSGSVGMISARDLLRYLTL